MARFELEFRKQVKVGAVVWHIPGDVETFNPLGEHTQFHHESGTYFKFSVLGTGANQTCRLVASTNEELDNGTDFMHGQVNPVEGLTAYALVGSVRGRNEDERYLLELYCKP